LNSQQSDAKLQLRLNGVQQEPLGQTPSPQQSQSWPHDVPIGRQHLVEKPAVLHEGVGSQTAFESQQSVSNEHNSWRSRQHVVERLHADSASEQQSPLSMQSQSQLHPEGAVPPHAPGAAQLQSDGQVKSFSLQSQNPFPQASPQSLGQEQESSPESQFPSPQQSSSTLIAPVPCEPANPPTWIL
jgi:hypothetical protein